MRNQAQGLVRRALLFSLLALVFQPGYPAEVEKKIRVDAESTHVYLQPDSSSAVIETLEKGRVLSLLTSRKIRKSWYYVYFKSEKTGATKSGYVLDSAVELLFDPLRSVTIAEERRDLRVNYAPRNFEEMQWGLSKKQVVEAEGGPVDQRKISGLEVLRYQQRIINLDCAIDYFFAANQLIRTRFTFAGDYLDKNAHLLDYQKVKGALVQKFGPPLEEAMKWRDTSLRDDSAAWGEAVSLGHLEMSSRWRTAETEITAGLTGADEEILLTVEYAGLRLKDLAKKSEE
jgi:hypothetical protein